jgi:acyl-CoA reductase-like NAD-dependent aldehyde dehydrogenase
MEAMMARIREAQKVWSSIAVRERLVAVKRFRHQMARQATDLACSIHLRHRASMAETLASELIPLADACRFLERKAEAILKPRALGRRGLPIWLTGIETTIYREPYGIVLIIGPSNYPLFLPGVQALQALVAGNCVLVKPGKDGREAAESLRNLMISAGLCEYAITILDESKEAAQAAISVGVDKVVLTGSVESGRAVLGRLTTSITPAVMELSGCDAVFVCEDADLDLVVKALRFGLTLNGGASCIAPRRVFVVRSAAAALEQRLVSAVGPDLRVPLLPQTLDKLARAVQEALRSGARLAAGDLPREDRMAPLIIADATADMQLLKEDYMAPLLALIPVDSIDHGLRMADHCPYALGAAVFGSLHRATALAKRINAGAVVINDMIVPTADPRLPFGGRKMSGFGITRGDLGLLELTRIKTISARKGGLLQHLEPFDPNDQGIFTAYILAAHGESLSERWRAMIRLFKLLAKRQKRSA